MVQICPSFISPKKKRLVETSRFSLLLVYTLDIPRRNTVPARFVTIFIPAERKFKVRLRRAVAGNCPPDSCIWVFKSDGPVSPKRKSTPDGVLFFLEVPARFELANNGFADRGLTTWLRYHMK